MLAALAAYQNPTAASATRWSQISAGRAAEPEPVEVAFRVLDEVGAMDDPMVTRACDWLASASTADGGVPFVLPSVLEHPRAPWWQTEPDPPAGLNADGGHRRAAPQAPGRPPVAGGRDRLHLAGALTR